MVCLIEVFVVFTVWLVVLMVLEDGLTMMMARFEDMDQKLNGTKSIMKENHGMIEEHLEKRRPMWI